MNFEFNPNTLLLASRDEIRPGHPHTNSEGRTRFIHTMWQRAPTGRFLEQNRAPVGFRTPNGHVWGHSLDELGYIERDPGIAWVTLYSRSQVKELGENYDDGEFDGPLVRPRVRRPWPVLKLPKRHPANTVPPLGAVDEGCEEEHEDPEMRTYTMRWDEFSDDTKGKGKATSTLSESTQAATFPPPKCTAQPCRGRLVRNDGPEPRPDRGGHAYHYLWCEHFAARLQAHEEPFRLVAHTIHMMNQAHLAADIHGLFVLGDGSGVDWDDLQQTLPAAARSGGNTFLAHAEDSIPGRPAAELDLVLPDVEPEDADDDSSTTKDTVAGDDCNAQSDNDIPMSDDPSSGTDCDFESDDGQEEKLPPASGLFSTQDLPKLEEFIPEQLFPDVLLVHDPHKLTNHKEAGQEGKPVRYRRIYPALPHDTRSKTSESSDANVNTTSPSTASANGSASSNTSPSPHPSHTAHLHLHPSNRLGEGHHSLVYRAPLTLPAPLSARSRTGQCTVAAKLALPRCTAHRLLHNEGRVYNALPRHAQEEYCGLNIVPPCRYPVPVGAIVPKLYGFYLPESEGGDEDGEEDKQSHVGCEEERACKVDWASPILLVEECGEPVQPDKFSADERTECFSLMLRLNHLNIIQGSFYVRNVLVQPGPLTAPPERRSRAHPSFRIIDFGRGRVWGREVSKERWEGMTKARREEVARAWGARLREELEDARRELLLEKHVGF